MVMSRVRSRDGDLSIQLPTADEQRSAEMVDANLLVELVRARCIKNDTYRIEVGVRLLGKADATRNI